jgi:hypothetical protein
MSEITLKETDSHDIPATGYQKLYVKTDGSLYIKDDGGTETEIKGNVVGDASSTDNAVARFDGTTGKVLQNSSVTVDDSGNIATSGTVDGRDLSTDGSKLDNIEANADVTDATNVAAAGAEMTANKNAASGYAGLDGSSKLTGSQQVYGSSANTACEGNDSRLSDSRTPTSHNTSHESGGGDAIKLDDLSAPDDNTDLNATTSAHGLLPKLGGGTTNYLRADGSWSEPPGGGSSYPEFQIFADQLEFPINSDWTVNVHAGGGVDSNNSAFYVRRFDDTTEEGIGFTVRLPSGITNIIIDIVSRAETAPGGSRTVGLKLYNRGLPNTVDSWTAGFTMDDIDIPDNEQWQYDSETIAISSLSVSAGEIVQFEMTRVNPQAGTELSGDWTLLMLGIRFS